MLDHFTLGSYSILHQPQDPSFHHSRTHRKGMLDHFTLGSYSILHQPQDPSFHHSRSSRYLGCAGFGHQMSSAAPMTVTQIHHNSGTRQKRYMDTMDLYWNGIPYGSAAIFSEGIRTLLAPTSRRCPCSPSQVRYVDPQEYIRIPKWTDRGHTNGSVPKSSSTE